MIKVELGCGKTKNEGYIGIDRFPFPGVDIVADLDLGIPMEDNSVDILLSCNSLEHFSDLASIMSEIYRICRNEAVVHILAPYYNTITNLANIYHKQVFNDDTFRFFSVDKTNEFVDYQKWDCPHACIWGLECSDNSEACVNFLQINVEYFYYKQYRSLNENQKINARSALSNVCDLIFYTLVVSKEGEISKERLNEIKEYAKKMEPPIIEELRQRDKVIGDNSSVLTDIKQLVIDQLRPYGEKLENAILQNDQAFHNEIKQMDSGLRQDIDNLAKEMKRIVDKQYELQLQIGMPNVLKNTEEQKYYSLTFFSNFLTFFRPEKLRFKKKYMLWSNPENLYSLIKTIQPDFIKALLSHSLEYGDGSRLCISPMIPEEGYLEYTVNGCGQYLKLFLFGGIGTEILLEIVTEGVICCQKIVALRYQGIYEVENPKAKNTCIRLKQVNNFSIAHTLEIANRSHFFLEKRTLATV